MHKILEIAFGVALGMIVFLVIAWLIGTCVYICCGNTKRIATVKKVKYYSKNESEEILEPKEETVSEPEKYE